MDGPLVNIDKLCQRPFLINIPGVKFKSKMSNLGNLCTNSNLTDFCDVDYLVSANVQIDRN